MDKHEEFLEKLKLVNEEYRNGEFEIITKYKKANEKIIVKNKYGYCAITPYCLSLNTKPYIKNAIDKTAFCIEQFKEVFGDRYDYSLVKYDKQKSKVKIICKKHGIFEQSPDTHKKGIGCFKCSVEKRTFSKEYVMSWLEENNYDESSSFELKEYKGSLSKIIVTCKVGHKYETKFCSRQGSGHGCKECHKMYLYLSNNNLLHKNTDDINCTFYVISLKKDKEIFYKVGISKNLGKRLKDIEHKSGYKVSLIYKEDTNLKKAWDTERYFIKRYKSIKKNGVPSFGGQTECFEDNPLYHEYSEYYYKDYYN